MHPVAYEWICSVACLAGWLQATDWELLLFRGVERVVNSVGVWTRPERDHL